MENTAVCLFACHTWYCVETTAYIIKLLHHSVGPSEPKRRYRIPTTASSTGKLNIGGLRKIWVSRLI